MTLNDAGIRNILAHLSAEIDAGVEETTHQAKDVRDPLTPVLTGELLGSGVVVQVAPGHWQLREGDGLPDARAAYTEYGTARAPAQPHVTPAAEAARVALPVNVGKRLKALADKSGI
jgi:hypothetical protein